jgi:hypothetical protein
MTFVLANDASKLFFQKLAYLSLRPLGAFSTNFGIWEKKMSSDFFDNLWLIIVPWRSTFGTNFDCLKNANAKEAYHSVWTEKVEQKC